MISFPVFDIPSLLLSPCNVFVGDVSLTRMQGLGKMSS